MSLPTQAQIDDLIQFIDTAEEAGTITNEYVATVLNFLNEKFKSGDLSIAELNSSLTTLQAALAGKASLDSDTGKLTYSQAPDVVLESMGSTLDNEGNTSIQQQVYMPEPGDTYWDSTTGRIKYKESDSTTHDLGEPNQGLVYCNKRTNLTYRWAGSSGWKQVGGAPNSSITIVNDLTTGGVEDGLSAEMGKRLKAKIEQVEGNIERLYNNLGNIAFWDAAAKTAAAPVELNWGNPKHTVTLALNLTDASVSYNGEPKSDGATIQVEEGSTLELIVAPDSGYTLTSNDVSSTTTGAVITDLENGTFKVALVMGPSNIALAITATAALIPQVSVTKNLKGFDIASETANVVYGQQYQLVLKLNKFYFPLGTYPDSNPAREVELIVTMLNNNVAEDITADVVDDSVSNAYGITIPHVTGDVTIEVKAVSYIAFRKGLYSDSGALVEYNSQTPLQYPARTCVNLAYIKIPEGASGFKWRAWYGSDSQSTNTMGMISYTKGQNGFSMKDNWMWKSQFKESGRSESFIKGETYVRFSMMYRKTNDVNVVDSHAYLYFIVNGSEQLAWDAENGFALGTVWEKCSESDLGDGADNSNS